MSEIHIPCPACETRIRFRSGLPDRDTIDCPQCGEVIPIRRPSPPRRPAPREDYDDRHREPPSRRIERAGSPPRPASPPPRDFRAGRRAKNPEGNSAGFWIGVIGGCVGLTCLVLGLIFFFHSKEKKSDLASNQETLAENAGADSATVSATDSSPNAAQQLMANMLSTPAAPGTTTANANPPGQPIRPISDGGSPAPTLQPGPDGVIPAPQAAGGAKPEVVSNRLKYGWNANRKFGFRTTIKAEIGNEIRNISGVAKYEVLGHDPAMARFAQEEEEEEEGMATGTGFVVHPDGYLMTCAHVVEDGVKVEVELGGRTYAARVVEVNSQRDLALIQIAARNLPVLPLGDSAQVELAQHVRLVGFPLSDVLGTSVKVTQGSVAGFIDKKNGRMIQVDASMNPGNSGGPLVNDRGDAIGVASAGYFGSRISEVGLAIPTNDVDALMRKNGVIPSPGGTGRILDGPELARKVTPSVAYLKVTIGSAPKESLALKQFSSFTTTKTRADGRPIPGGPSVTTESGKLLVNEAGQILHSEGTNQTLPFCLGPLSQLAIEPISPGGETTWGTTRLTTITQVQRADAGLDPYSRIGGGPGSRYRPRGFPPRPRSPFAPSAPTETVKHHLAVEVCEYEFAESTPALQVIKKTYEFQTIDDVEKPYFKLSGSGSIRFDRTRSMPDQIHYQLTVQVRGDDGSIGRVPVDIFCQRLTDEEMAQQNQQASAVTPQAQQPARTSPAPQTTRPARSTPAAGPAKSLDDHLAKIGDATANFSEKYIALNAVKNTTPDDKHRKKVLDTVEPLLKDSNPSLQTTAISVFGEWGTEDRAAVLIEMAGGFSQSHRWAAMRALGKIGGKKCAEAVVKRLTDSTDMLTAANALKEMGSVAEEPVLKLIDHEDEQVRLNVYRVLGKVGGPKSQAALKDKSENDPSGYHRAAAGIALQDLERR